VSSLSVDDFPRVFERIHGHPPFAWQTRLLREVMDGGWPARLAAPTGAGKTAALDVALFHLALELSHGDAASRRAPMRIVFAVDRRLIVDQACERAKTIKRKLETRDDKLSAAFADALGAPLHVEEIRGGLPREDDWARTPAQPTILCTTVDQLGSRLMFRGYGVSESMAPVHAGLLGHDALILLDEAHLSTAFEETLRYVGRRRGPAVDAAADLRLPAPWSVCALTATPRGEERIFRLNQQERAEPAVAIRLDAKKLVELVDEKAALGSQEHIATFVREAKRLAQGRRGGSIAIVVNRVARARAIRESLSAEGNEAILLTGRARPLARDRLLEEFGPRLFSGRATEGAQPLFVVATQCIEAGADFDFDAMVTQIAPLDCLRQRFGRLDRLGLRSPTAGVVAAVKDEIGAKEDAIYGDRLKKTSDWVNAKAVRLGEAQNPRIDFGPDTMEATIAGDPTNARSCMSAAKSAPVLRAADVEFFTMTNPRPHPDPHLPLFLHGDPRVDADVSIVWRADLPDPLDETAAKEIIACLPPRPAEALAISLWEARRWLTGAALGEVADLEGAAEADETTRPTTVKVLRWRGPDDPETRLVPAGALRGGDTIVVPAAWGGCDAFGWAPASRESVEDLADAAAEPYSARRAALRLHPALWRSDDAPWDEVARLLQERKDGTSKALIDALIDLLRGDSSTTRRLTRFSKAEKLDPLIFPYDEDPEGESPTGAIIVAPRGLLDAQGSQAFAESVTDGGDAGSFGGAPLPLADHIAQVETKAREFARSLGLRGRLTETIAFAARHHDDGKADPRFQTYLAGGEEPGAEPLAKSGRRWPPAVNAKIRAASGLPANWRHEALSVRLAAQQLDSQDTNLDAALALYLIGSHHGQGRIFFRHDDPWDDLERTIGGRTVRPCAGPQRLDFDWHGCDWAELFAELNARYGAWGLAYLEAVFRLADHRASEEADRRNGSGR
jgi:CRISPR-associated endonuclease/helicase Cas3